MSKVLKQTAPKRKHRALRCSDDAVRLEWRDRWETPYVVQRDNDVGRASCLRCIDPPCLTFASDELEIPSVPEFPSDRNDRCCPTGAIVWEHSSTPVVDPDLCIGCGICIKRCPAGAIYLTKEMIAAVSDVETDAVSEEAATYDSARYSRSRIQLSTAIRSGAVAETNDELMANLYRRLESIATGLSPQFVNLLVRNLLLVLDLRCGVRRLGDTNVRMDMVFTTPYGGAIGTGEIELGAGVLDAPRNILDNVAVLSRRYALEKEKLLTLIVTLSLPNKRSEYWQVLEDIRKVVGLKIGTVSLGALVSLALSNSSLATITAATFGYEGDECTIRHALTREGVDCRQVSLGYLGVLESLK